MKITSTITAWLPESSQQQLHAAIKDNDHKSIVGSLLFYNLDMSPEWTRIGEATITVDVPDENEIKLSMVESLKAERERVLADAQVKANEIEEKIQNLLAITWNGNDE